MSHVSDIDVQVSVQLFRTDRFHAFPFLHLDSIVFVSYNIMLLTLGVISFDLKETKTLANSSSRYIFSIFCRFFSFWICFCWTSATLLVCDRSICNWAQNNNVCIQKVYRQIEKKYRKLIDFNIYWHHKTNFKK